MLEVHLPHKGIRQYSEFLIHLITITVGLLIATQIESCVEWRHHVHLAEEARTALRAEIERNLKDLKNAQPGLKVWREQIDADLKAMQRIQDNPKDPKAQHYTLTVSSSGIMLPDTAWRTAQSTGAFAYIPYEEAEKYSNIYQAQAALMAYEDKPLEDVAGIIGLLAKYNFDSSHSSKVNVEQASALAERFGQMRLHLANGSTLLEMCIETSDAFLQNRKARESFGNNLNRP
jgi:hypothetical protein